MPSGVKLLRLRKCRKLRTGQVAFSPALQNTIKMIRAWSLVVKKRKGEKTSSRLLARTLNQLGITQSARDLPLEDLELSLKEAYQDYYKLKAHHHTPRQSYLHELAEALAESQKTSKETLIRTDKTKMEQAIMWNNESKFHQSIHTLLFQDPLLKDFGVKGTTQAATVVLAGVYQSNCILLEAVNNVLQQLQMPLKVQH